MSLIRNALPQIRPRYGLLPSIRRVSPSQRCFSKVNKTQALAAENTVSQSLQQQPELLQSLFGGKYGAPSTLKQADKKDLDRYIRNELGHTTQQMSSTLTKLRESCTCTRCVDPGDHQRHFVFADIPTEISIAGYEIDSNGDYLITWQNDIPGYSDHVSYYTKEEIQRLSNPYTTQVEEYGKRPRKTWNAANYDMKENTVSYNDYMNDEASLARLLDLVSRYGLAFINDIPSEADSVNKMAERVGPIRGTFYGETWDVKSMPDATNVAYTSRFLGFHMDMLYVREPPGLQFLHCIENTCEGGESRFADTFNAADHLVSQEGEKAFEALQSMKVKYHYRRPGTYTSAIKPVFDTEGRESKPAYNFTNVDNPDLINKLHRIYWSPPFTGRALGNGRDDHAVDQLEASKSFHDILEDETSVIETKVPPGTCAVFDNFRVVHARQAFDLNSGNRWLRVAYVDDADFQSRAVTLVDKMPPVDGSAS